MAVGFTTSNTATAITAAKITAVSISEVSDGDKNRHSAAMVDSIKRAFLPNFPIPAKMDTFFIIYHPYLRPIK
jgi:hypothetical protein